MCLGTCRNCVLIQSKESSFFFVLKNGLDRLLNSLIPLKTAKKKKKIYKFDRTGTLTCLSVF